MADQPGRPLPPAVLVPVLVAGLAGQAAAATSGALRLLPLAAVVLVGAALVAHRAPASWTRGLHLCGSLLAVAVVVLALPRLAGTSDPLQAKGTLGTLLVGVQIGQALSWRTSRDARTGLAIAGGLLVLGASYAPDVLVGAPLLVGWVAVLVALARLAGAARAVLPATAVTVVVGLVAFLLVPVPAAGVRKRLGGGGAATSRAAGAAAFSGSTLDLRVRGALRDDPVATVDPSSPVLWRASTYDVYDGRTWYRPVTTGAAPHLDGAVPPGRVRTDHVQLARPTDGTVWAPGTVLQATSDGQLARLTSLGDATLPPTRGGYDVISVLPESDPARLRSRAGADAGDPRWRRLPVSLPARVRTLAAALTVGATDRWDAAEQIATWLRANATYRLDSPVPGPGEDAVDRFLFVDRTGFCEQFASAEVVLLRSLGVPARLVTGLAYGVPGPGGRLYREKDLHAWVELWVPGVGWVTSDPTAGVPLAAGSAGLRARVSAAVMHALRALAGVPGGRPALAVALGLLAVLVGWLVRVLAVRLRRRPAPVAPVASRGPAGPALAAFLRLDARLGPRARRPAESLRELGGRLDPAVAGALEVVEQECYAPLPPDPAEAVQVLDRA